MATNNSTSAKLIVKMFHQITLQDLEEENASKDNIRLCAKQVS